MTTHRDRWLMKVATVCAVVAALCVYLIVEGCAAPLKVTGYCVPESIYSAWTWEAKTGQPSRIAVSNIRQGVDHAQAQGWDGSKWVYLTSMNGEVRQWEAHFGTVPYRYWTLDEWIENQKQFRRGK